MTLAPQLEFNGDCRAAFEAYATLLGGEVAVMNSFGAHEDVALPPGSSPLRPEAIRFAEVRFPGGVLRGNDVAPEAYAPVRGCNLALHLDDAAEAERIFAGLADGGRVTTALGAVDWAARFGMVTDRFGVSWLILATGSDPH